MAPTLLHHGSHGHQLQLMGVSETNGMASSCRACSLPFKSGKVLYGCCYCSYFLHSACAQLSPWLQGHAAHKQHPLRLFYAPACGTAAFLCNICGNSGSGFSYRCERCNFIAHSLCVQMPQTVRTAAHQHVLRLSYQPRSKGSTYCDACRLQIHYSNYSCSDCIVELHPGCTNKQLIHSDRKKGYKRAQAKKVMGTVGLAAVGIGMNALFGGTGLETIFHSTDADDVDDVADIGDDGPYGSDDYGVDMGTFYSPAASDGTVDNALVHEEATCLLCEHMEEIGAGTGTSPP